jgi:hypothetical protein
VPLITIPKYERIGHEIGSHVTHIACGKNRVGDALGRLEIKWILTRVNPDGKHGMKVGPPGRKLLGKPLLATTPDETPELANRFPQQVHKIRDRDSL